MIIGGEKVESEYNKKINVVNPYDSKVIDDIPVASKTDVQKSLEAARKGYIEWKKLSPHERETILKRYIILLEKNKKEIAEVLSLEQDRPYKQCLNEIEAQVRDVLPAYIESYKYLDDKAPLPGAYSFNKNDFQVVVREPMGVIVAIIAYNSPITILFRKIIPALISGNAIVVKPASDAPLAVIKCVDLLIKAGVTPEAINLITGRGKDVGNWISESSLVDVISFTGSTQVGIDLVKKSSVNLTRCHLELGGNDAFIVLNDADIDKAVREASKGRIPLSGQVCASPKRLIVQEDIHDEFVLKLKKHIQKFKTRQTCNSDGDINIGGLINENAAEKALEQINHTKKQGATIIHGGNKIKNMIEPTIITNVTKDMDIAQDMEVFAPVFAIIKVKDDNQAVDIANNTQYGLSGSVFSQDVQKAFNIAKKIESGQVAINSHGWYLNPSQPFGGYKKSGLGREGIWETIDAFTQEKTISLRNFLT